MLKTDREHEALAVYADLLLAEADPRGELITIVLHIERAGDIFDRYSHGLPTP